MRWPSSIVQEFSNVERNQVLRILEDRELLQGTSKPVFSAQPQEQIIEPGEALSLIIAFEGGFQPSIRWYRNDQLLAGEGSQTLTIDPIATTHAGIYFAIATNDAGSTRSEDAIVSVRSLFPDKSIARQWNEALLDAIRINFPDPTIVSRNLYHASVAMWDAF